MTLSATEAAVRTLRDHFRLSPLVGIQAADIVSGWDEQLGDIEYPTVGIDASIPGSRMAGQVGIWAQEDVDPDDETNPDILVTAVVAHLELPLKVNIWASSHQSRAVVERSIEDALHSNVLDTGGQLFLEASADEYYGAGITYRQSTPIRHTDAADSAGRREFRAELEIVASLPELRQVTAKKLLELQLGTVVVESTLDFSGDPQETVTVFSPSSP